MRFRYSPVLLLMASASPAICQVQIKSVDFPIVTIGKPTIVRVFGNNLKDANLKSPTATITAKPVQVKPTEGPDKPKGSQIAEIEVRVEPACSIGVYKILWSGVKDAPVFNICVVPATTREIEVKRPNQTFKDAMVIDADSVSIKGVMLGDNPDLFRFEAKMGQTFQIGAVGAAAGGTMDPIIRVRNARRVSLALSAGPEKRIRELTWKAPEDGTFYLELSEAEGRGGGDFRYLLYVVRKGGAS